MPRGVGDVGFKKLFVFFLSALHLCSHAYISYIDYTIHPCVL